MMTRNQFYLSFFFVTLLGHVVPVYGQMSRVRLTVSQVFASREYDAWSSDDYRYKVWVNGVRHPQECIRRQSEDSGWLNIDDVEVVNGLAFSVENHVLIKMEAWESGCDPECQYTSCDQAHCPQEILGLDILRFPPVLPQTRRYKYCDNDWGAEYKFSYDLPQPSKPTLQGVPVPARNICQVNPEVTLDSKHFVHNDFINDMEYIWEYHTTATGWRYLATTSGLSTNFNINDDDEIRNRPNGLRDLDGIRNAVQNVDVKFRVLSRYLRTYTSVVSAESDAIHIGPLPPNEIGRSIRPSCSNTGTGQITIELDRVGNYVTALLPGHTTEPCDPEKNCGGISQRFDNTRTIRFSGMGKGPHTVLIANPGGDEGVCPNYRLVTVHEIPPLQLRKDSTAVSCYNGTDGAVRLTSSGGTTPVTFSLTSGSFSVSNGSGLFQDLPGGTYNASAVDGVCNQLISTRVIVDEPLPVSASLEWIKPTCVAPGNGSMQVNNVQGEGQYSFTLLRDGVVVDERNSTATSWVVDNLAAGNYTVEIKDAQRLQCAPFIQQNIEFAAPDNFSLHEENIAAQHATCFLRSDGSIQLNNVDVTGKYRYTLTPQPIGNAETLSTESRFDNLNAGTYTLSMTRTVEGCTDRFNYPLPIEILQPQEVGIALHKQDISCFGQINGRINATITGTTSSDLFSWEIKLGDHWSTFNKTTPSLENLQAGIYRMRLTNDYACSATSSEIEVVEPALVAFANVTVRDIVCYDTKGIIETTLQGGVQPYSYELTSSGQSIRSHDAVAFVDKGIYTLRVNDANGCEALYMNPITITAPAIPLAMSWVYSDYNGYNISCSGAADGYLDISGRGGNGDRYTKYEYTIDDRPFQQGRITNISEGQHTIFVRDDRGCTIGSTIIMTAPYAQVKPVLLSKQDVKCFGDTNGAITLRAQGGLEPYTYTLKDGTQDNGSFSSLPAGEYSIIISDRNKCTVEYTTTIAVLTPPMDIHLNSADVHCHSGADGSISAEVNGGILPLQYAWSNGVKNAHVTNLQAGDYEVQVTDHHGCIRKRAITITEPEALSMRATVIPVCVGKTNGEITLTAMGGTPGYQYSIDDGVSYHDHATFTVNAGEYTVHVKDNHSCDVFSSTEVITRNDLPEPDFIVASTQHVADELVVKEISVPQPDSVTWMFDPAITIVKHEDGYPIISVTDPGEYSISMTGFFRGCDYTKTRTLTISPVDPDVKQGKEIPNPVIKVLTATPNPNNGEFDVTIELNTKQRLSLLIYDALSVLQVKQHWNKTMQASTKIKIPESGVYVMHVATDTDSRCVRIVVTH
jgi:hypothetical protein